MATLVRMPEVVANSSRVTVAAWTVKQGALVAEGECIAELESEKAVVELPSPVGGIVGRLLAEPGAEIEVGQPLCVLLAPDESQSAIDALLLPEANAQHQATSDAGSSVGLSAGTVRLNSGKRVLSSPLARRLAQQAEIDIGTLVGSGPNGRVVKRDVQVALQKMAERNAGIAPPYAAQNNHQPAASANFTEAPPSAMRRSIARRLTESKTSIPHFYLAATCCVDRLLKLREEINNNNSRKISINDFVVRAAAVALREVPAANVCWTEKTIRSYTAADIAVAVATESGLLTPIVKAADKKTLSAISAEIATLAHRARKGQLQPSEYQGGTFSISNLGMYGVDDFAAIINPPHAAILAVGAVREQAVVEAGQLRVGSTMRVVLSADHRAIDGATGAQWLSSFRQLLEAPLALLV